MTRCGAAVLAASCLVVACGAPAPLLNARASPEALAQSVLDGLARHDRAALEALAVSEREFREHVWPALPAARPERNLPFSYVWGDLRQKSAGSLSATLASHAGMRYELLGMEFAGVTDYGAYRVHRGTTLRVRDARGRHLALRLSGSLIERAGGWKVFSYVVD